MKIAIIKERAFGEARVAATPEMVKKLTALGFKVYIEKNAGIAANFTDQDYQNNGGIISNIPLEIFADADLVLGVQPLHSDGDFDLLSFLRAGTTVIGLLSPFEKQSIILQYAEKKINCLSMELLPRISRAQSMDVLSSQNNLAGYRAVIDAAYEYGKAFPMMMTAAGVVAPAKTMVLGAGVAGLQAIATAKRLGAIVTAFDVRAATKEQVESLGAKFIAVDEQYNNLDKNAVYAKEMSADYKQKQQELIASTICNQDIVISTALIPGKTAPILITAEMVSTMKPGSVIVDLGAASGGNCELTKKDEIVVTAGVKIIGYGNFPARIPADASRLFARNVYNFLELLLAKNSNQINLDSEDEIIRASVVTHNGQMVNKLLEEVYKK